MRHFLSILYGDHPSDWQTWEKRERNAKIYHRYLNGKDSVTLAGIFGLSDRRVRSIIEHERKSGMCSGVARRGLDQFSRGAQDATQNGDTLCNIAQRIFGAAAVVGGAVTLGSGFNDIWGGGRNQPFQTPADDEPAVQGNRGNNDGNGGKIRIDFTELLRRRLLQQGGFKEVGTPIIIDEHSNSIRLNRKALHLSWLNTR